MDFPYLEEKLSAMSFQFPKKEESPLQGTWEMDNCSHGAKNNPGRHGSRPEGNTHSTGDADAYLP